MLPGLKGARVRKGQKDNLGEVEDLRLLCTWAHVLSWAMGVSHPPAQKWISSFLLSLWSFPGGLLLTTCGSC